MHISGFIRAVLAASVTVGLLSTASVASASGILVHDFNLNNSLADSLPTGLSLTANGGTLGATGYTFGADQGLSLSSGINATDYSIVLDFSITNTAGFRKLVDFKNLTSDNGLYNLNTALNYFNVVTGPASAITANTELQVILTRNAATNTVNGYVNHVLQFSFGDPSGDATFTGPSQIVNFFIDDFPTGQNEASPGFADEIRIYNGALTADQIGQLPPPGGSGPSPVPEPASLSLLGMGLIAGARGWQKRRAKS